MKPSVMGLLVRRNSVGILSEVCRRLGARDATGRLWNTSLNHSPPVGR
jgi:hypothetical protein